MKRKVKRNKANPNWNNKSTSNILMKAEEYVKKHPEEQEALEAIKWLVEKTKSSVNSFDPPMMFADKKENDMFIALLKNSCSTDTVELTEEINEKLSNLWKKDKNSNDVPSDIFFAKTIPLKDMEIIIKDNEGNNLRSFRVLIVDDYQDIVPIESPQGLSRSLLAGLVSINIKNSQELIIPIMIIEGFDHIGFAGIAASRNMDEQTKKLFTASFVHDLLFPLLASWYSVQISLLYPITKDIYANPQRIKKTQLEDYSNRKNTNAKIKYVRKHVINAEELNEKLERREKENKEYHRKALVWYVTGHWRNYKSGKKIFIQPYFKGPLRKTKKIETRDREIVVPDKQVVNN